MALLFPPRERSIYDDWFAQWIKNRQGEANLSVRIPTMRKLVDYCKAAPTPSSQLMLQHGYGIDHHARFTRLRYIKQFPKRDDADWMNAKIDQDVVSIYRSKGVASRYGGVAFKPDRNYALCLMGDIWPRLFAATIECLKYATISKTYTLFKPHPRQSKRDIEKFWSIAASNGYVSEYTVLYYGDADAFSMIDQCEFAYSPDSSLGLWAAIKGKAFFHTSPTVLIDLIDCFDSVSHDYQPKTLDHSMVDKWITWYYNVVVVDLSLDRYKEHLQIRQGLYEIGMSDHELLTWKVTAKHGLHRKS